MLIVAYTLSKGNPPAYNCNNLYIIESFNSSQLINNNVTKLNLSISLDFTAIFSFESYAVGNRLVRGRAEHLYPLNG